MNKLDCFIACVIGLVLCATAQRKSKTSECYDKPDGKVVVINCFYYQFCQDNAVQTFNCTAGKVFERDSQTCVDIGTGNTACGTIGNCTGKDDGFYPDPNCQTFYYCQNGNFQPNTRYYCPHNLLFDGELCNWPYSVPAPCGTFNGTEA